MMDEEADGNLMHFIGFGKGEGAAHKASHALAQGIVPTLDMVRLAALLAAVMLLCWHDLSIGRPEVAVAKAMLVSRSNATPQHAAGGFTTAAHGISYDLPGASAQSQPKPPLVLACPHK